MDIINFLTAFYNETIVPNSGEILKMMLGGIIVILFPNSKYGKVSWIKTLEIKDYVIAGINIYFLTRRLDFLSGMEDPQNNVIKNDPVIRKALVSLAIENGYYLAVKQVFEDSGYVFKEKLINSMTKIVYLDKPDRTNKSLINSTVYVVTIPSNFFDGLDIQKIKEPNSIVALPPYN
jgi:hypothetical protein